MIGLLNVCIIQLVTDTLYRIPVSSTGDALLITKKQQVVVSFQGIGLYLY